MQAINETAISVLAELSSHLPGEAAWWNGELLLWLGEVLLTSTMLFVPLSRQLKPYTIVDHPYIRRIAALSFGQTASTLFRLLWCLGRLSLYSLMVCDLPT